MNIQEISVIQDPLEMKLQVFKLADEKGCTEDDIWVLIDGFRKTHTGGQCPHIPRVVGGVLEKILSKVRIVTESWIEDRLKYELQRRDIEFETQIKIGKYRVDFMFPQARLIIEADGKEYHSTQKQLDKDFDRELYLISKGYTVMRFTGGELYANIDKCVDKIERILPQEAIRK